MLNYENYELIGGDSIRLTIVALCQKAKVTHRAFKAHANGVTCFIDSTSNPMLLYRDYLRCISGDLRSLNIGPQAKAKLSKKENLRRIGLARQKKNISWKQNEERLRVREGKKCKVKNLLQAIPTFDVASGYEQEFKDAHQNYAPAIACARLMQTDFPISYEKYEKYLHIVDTEGLSGCAEGIMAKFIAHFWKHGEEFRKIYNAHHGYYGHDGIVNPAIVTINDNL